jgi:hypothetical protein
MYRPRVLKIMNIQRALKRRRQIKYTTAKDSPDVRNTVGAVYKSMRDHGLKRKLTEEILLDAGFDYPARTLRRYSTQIKAGASPVPSP